MDELIQPIAPALVGLGPTPAGDALRRPPTVAAPGAAANPAMEKAAKDFESVLLNTLLQEMGKTVENSGLLESGTTQQVQGIFWMYLSQDLAGRGGLGLWKNLMHHMPTPAASPAPAAASPAPGSASPSESKR